MKENYAPRWQELLVLPSGPMSDSDFLSFSLLSDDFPTSGQGFRAWNPLPLPHLLPRWWLRSHVRPSHVNHVCVSLALSVYLEARSVPFGKQSLVTIFKSPCVCACVCALLVKKGEKVFLEFPGKAKKKYILQHTKRSPAWEFISVSELRSAIVHPLYVSLTGIFKKIFSLFTCVKGKGTDASQDGVTHSKSHLQRDRKSGQGFSRLLFGTLSSLLFFRFHNLTKDPPPQFS